MYQTKITSQGTISIPVALRRKYGLKPGEVVTLEDTGKITISKRLDLISLRKLNLSHLKHKIQPECGSGYTAHVKDKYGQAKK